MALTKAHSIIRTSFLHGIADGDGVSLKRHVKPRKLLLTDLLYTCCDDLALIRMVSSRLEDRVRKEAGTPLEGGQVPDDAGPIR